MATGSYYREEARRCRVRAAREPYSVSRSRWLQFAAEYEELADELEQAQPSRPLINRLMQLQESQQHRTKEGSREQGSHEPNTA